MELISYVTDALIYIAGGLVIVLIGSYISSKLGKKKGNTKFNQPQKQRPVYQTTSRSSNRSRVRDDSRNTELRNTELERRKRKTKTREKTGNEEYDIMREIRRKKRKGRFQIINDKHKK